MDSDSKARTAAFQEATGLESPLDQRTGALAAWNRFWFRPADPTLLGLIRIACGLITLYTMFMYSFKLQEFMGENAWYDLPERMEHIRNRPMRVQFLSGHSPNVPPPLEHEKALVEQYFKTFNTDFRVFGLPYPKNEFEKTYLEVYSAKHNQPPPPPYPQDSREADAIEEYIAKYNLDPRFLYARGMTVWSLWFDVTDPTAMAWIHGGVVLSCFLFMIGFATRVTSVLTWMTCLWYIHRNNLALFGVDTMMTIVLLYLMIGPSGAALSVDRLLARWWQGNKLHCVNRWRRLWGKPPWTAAEMVPPAPVSDRPEPLVSANVALRLLQIHVCIIYAAAGFSKLLGHAWWNGTAVWGTLANFEFAPMQFEIYNWFLRTLSKNQLVWEIFMTSAGVFTLAFEIGYAFLIWRPTTRWWYLAGAIVLHGFIGLFMGLKTFSLMMLVMNMAFLTPRETLWIVDWFQWGTPKATAETPVAA